MDECSGLAWSFQPRKGQLPAGRMYFTKVYYFIM